MIQRIVSIVVCLCMAALFFTSCLMSCKCTEYDSEGNKTGNSEERGLPKGYDLNCTEYASDSIALEGGGGYICK